MSWLRALPPDLGHRDVVREVCTALCPASYLEVGVRDGDSVLAALDGYPRIDRLCLCDDWGSSYGGTGQGSHDHVASALERLNWRGAINWLDGRSADLLPGLADTYDVVHIDGDHSEVGAFNDLRYGWNLCLRAMIVHDTAYSGVRAALGAFFASLDWFAGAARVFGRDTGTLVMVHAGVER